MAAQGGTFDDAYQAIKQIAINCTFEEFDVEKAPLFDLEYLFLNIRAKSVGETLTPNIKCPVCDKNVSVNINLMDAKVSQIPERNIKLTESVGIVLNFPTFNITKIEAKNDNEMDKDFEAIYECVDYVYDKEQTYSKKDFTFEEFKEYMLESLNDEMYKKIVDFFVNVPTVYIQTTAKCSCGATKDIKISGAQDFLF